MVYRQDLAKLRQCFFAAVFVVTRDKHNVFADTGASFAFVHDPLIFSTRQVDDRHNGTENDNCSFHFLASFSFNKEPAVSLLIQSNFRWLTLSAAGKSSGIGNVTLPVAAHWTPRLNVVMNPTHSCE